MGKKKIVELNFIDYEVTIDIKGLNENEKEVNYDLVNTFEGNVPTKEEILEKFECEIENLFDERETDNTLISIIDMNVKIFENYGLTKELINKFKIPKEEINSFNKAFGMVYCPSIDLDLSLADTECYGDLFIKATDGVYYTIDIPPVGDGYEAIDLSAIFIAMDFDTKIKDFCKDTGLLIDVISHFILYVDGHYDSNNDDKSYKIRIHERKFEWDFVSNILKEVAK